MELKTIAKIGSIFFLAIVFISFVNAGIRTDNKCYFNMTNDINDSSGNNFDGLVAGTHLSSGGIIDGYYSFNGIDNQIQADDCSVVQEGEFTIMGWIKANSTSGNVDTIFSHGCSSTDNCIYNLRDWVDADGKPTVYIRDDNSNVKVNEIELTRVTNNNTWVHVTMTYDNTYVVVYVNNIVAFNQSYVYNPVVWDSIDYFTIGSFHRSSGFLHYFNGHVDEFGIWNRTLSLNEIESVYNLNLDGCNIINNATCSYIPPSLVINTNFINNSIGYNNTYLNFNYNGTLSGDYTKDIVNVSFYVNNVLNNTFLNINISENNLINLSFGSLETPLNISLNFSLNVSNFEVSANTGLYYYNIYVVPLIINETTITTSMNLSGLEQSVNNVATSFNNFTTMILFIIVLILFVLIQLTKVNNFVLNVIALIFFVALQIKFISINETAYSWVCFAGWVLCLFDIIRNDEEN